MHNFEIFELDQKNIYGIRILKNINVGNINYLNSFLWIKYDEETPFSDGKKYQALIFNNVSIEMMETIKQAIEIEYNIDPQNISLSEILEKLSNFFKKIRKENLKKEYIGLLGELLFIYKMKQKNIEVINFYQKSLIDRFDFNFNGNKLDIKVVKLNERTFKINKKQLVNLIKYDYNVSIIELAFDTTKNGKNLEDIFILINDSNSLNFVYERIKKFKDADENMFKNMKIDINQSNIYLYDKKWLKKQEDDFISNDSIVDAIFKIYFHNDLNKDIFEVIKGYINGN